MTLYNWIFGDDSSRYYYKYKLCYSCKVEKKVNNKQPYIYKIKGIGKLHNKFICHNCMEDKFLKAINNSNNNCYYRHRNHESYFDSDDESYISN